MHHCTVYNAMQGLEGHQMQGPSVCLIIYIIQQTMLLTIDAVGLSKFDLGNQKNEILASRKK